MKVTADTITDEQIRELKHAIVTEMDTLGAVAWRVAAESQNDCRVALGQAASRSKGGKRRARERCAAAWNARHGGES